jgi:hypothetical protein
MVNFVMRIRIIMTIINAKRMSKAHTQPLIFSQPFNFSVWPKEEKINDTVQIFHQIFLGGCAAWLAFEALNKKEPALMIERIPDT